MCNDTPFRIISIILITVCIAIVTGFLVISCNGAPLYSQLETMVDEYNTAQILANTVAAPEFSVKPGTYDTDLTVKLSCATGEASIYYTTDGSTPDTKATQYSSAIEIEGPEAEVTVKAIATKEGMFDSEAASGTFIVSYEVPPKAPSLSEITLQQNTTPITSGSYTHDCGSAYADLITSTGTLLIPFTIGNTGSESLVISSISLSGSDSSHYAIDDSVTDYSVAPGESTTFHLRFTPSSGGTKGDASVTINSNDEDEGAFSFALTGDGMEVDIVTTGDTHAFLSGFNYDSGSQEVKFYLSLSAQIDIDFGAGTSPQQPIYTLNRSNIIVEESINSGPYQVIPPEDITLTTVGDVAENKAVFLLLDSSVSVSTTEFNELRNTVKNVFVPELEQNDQAAVASFSAVTQPSYAPPEPVYNTRGSGNIDPAIDALLYQGQNSIIYDPVFSALQDIDNDLPADMLCALFLFCDGYDQGNSSADHNQCVDFSTAEHIPIYYIAWSSAAQGVTNPAELASSGFYTYDPGVDYNLSVMQDNVYEAHKYMQETYVLYWNTSGSTNDGVDVRVTVQYGDTSATYTTHQLTEAYTVQ